MSFLPTVKDELCSITETKIQVLYENKYIDLNDPEIDDSHIHSCYEIYFNISGNVSFLHGSEVYAVKSGDVIFSKPGDVHHCIYHSSCIHEFFCVWFTLPANSPAADFIDKNRFGGLMRYNEEKSNKLLELLNRLRDADDAQSFEKTVYFLNLIESLADKPDICPKPDTTLPDKISDILGYIDENFTVIRNMEEVASKFYISVPTMNRWFKEYINLSPYRFLTAKKLSRSEKLLKEGYCVTEACFMAGFCDCSRFISLFKKRYGKTPFQYKKEYL